MPEVETSAPDDLRSALGAAFASYDKPEEEVEEKAAPEAVSHSTETEETPAKEEPAETVSEEAKEPEEAKAAQPEEKEEKEEKPEDKTPAALKAWKRADREMFEELPEHAQEFLLRRHKEMESDYHKKLTAISELKKEYEPVNEMFKPYADVMRQKGFTPRTLIEAWANVEKRLMQGEGPAIQVIHGLMQGYGVRPENLIRSLGIQIGQQPQPSEQQPPQPQQQQLQLPPQLLQELNMLRERVNYLSTGQQQTFQAAQTAAAQRAEAAAQQFRDAKDAQGNLLYPYVADVEHDMLAMANALKAANQPIPPIEDLYERAVWANPSTRARLRTAEKQAAEAKRIEQEKAKAAAAKRAAVSVSGAPGSGQTPGIRGRAERSLREELDEAFASAQH